MNTDETQVLTFTLGDGEYCVSIDYVAEIVDDGQIRSLPNTDPHIVGVTDLRGKTTTIVDPCKRLNIDTGELLTDGGQANTHIVVLDSDTLETGSSTGWLVSDVNQVMAVTDEAVDAESVEDIDLLRGLIKNGDRFTLWLEPQAFTASY